MFGFWDAFSSVAQKLGVVWEQKTLFRVVVQQLFVTRSCRVRQSLSVLPVIENHFKVWGTQKYHGEINLQMIFLFYYNKLYFPHIYSFLFPRDVSHGGSSTISQPFIASSSSTSHHQNQYDHDRKRRKSGHSINSSSLHRRSNTNNFSNQSRALNEFTPDHLINPSRGIHCL